MKLSLLFSSLWCGTFSFSSALETTHKGWPRGTSCGRDRGPAQTQTKAEKGDYGGKTGSCEKGVKIDRQGLGVRPGQEMKPAR